MNRSWWGTIWRMFKTFLQRWWIINRLHRFCVENKGIVWANEQRFIKYLKEIVTDKSKPNNIVNSIRFPYFWIGEIKDDLLLYQKLMNLIDECSDTTEGVGLIFKKPNNKNHPLGEQDLRLTSLGRERYSVSYIIFGTDYAKTIWTGLIVGLVVWYTTYRIESILPKNPATIQVEYVQPPTLGVSTSTH